MESTIRLFKAFPIHSKRGKNPSKELLEQTIKRGFIFSPEVIYNYSNYDDLIKLVEKEIGLTGEQLNSTFHKSWGKIKDASIEQLVFEQIVHYFTTYGFESLGIYDEESVYIPHEKLEIPMLNVDVKLTIIKGYTKKELKEKVIKLINSGLALKKETIDDLCDVIEFVGISIKEVEEVKNRELKIRLYEELDLIPKDPTEFLRYVIYKTTNETLLIKNDTLIKKIKEKPQTPLFRKYKTKYGLETLSQVFHRFKPLFLAFKYGTNKKYINKIRKLAKKNHKPMNLDYLNEITGLIKNSNKIDSKLLKTELEKVNTFRKIRLAYALKYRTLNVNSILYQIRNGKAFAKEFEVNNKTEVKRVLKIVLDSIIKDVEKNVKGKKIYLPKDMIYSLPATEKQFIGNFPIGSYVSIPEDMIVGINWKNINGHRIDLDLSTQSIEGKIGWDSRYRSEARDMLFSGDITDASGPNGATEVFYIKKQIKCPYTLNLNYYNYKESIDVPFKILVAREKATYFKQNYLVNPNNIISICNTKIDEKQKVLGLLLPTSSSTRFYFTDFSMGKTITALDHEYTQLARDAMFNKFENQIELKYILEKAGAKLVETEEKADINLSPESLEKDTILNLFINVI